MDDLALVAQLGDGSTLYVSPVDSATYKECVEYDTLGGADGYFIVRAVPMGKRTRLDVLAKAATFEAASCLFDLVVARQQG